AEHTVEPAVQCVLLKFVQGLQRRRLVIEFKRLVFQGLGQLEWLRQLRQQGKQALDHCGSNSASCETGAEIKAKPRAWRLTREARPHGALSGRVVRSQLL